jgi:hypothetical protein
VPLNRAPHGIKPSFPRRITATHGRSVTGGRFYASQRAGNRRAARILGSKKACVGASCWPRGQRAERKARSQPPEKTNRGNVTHCSQKMRATALSGLVNGSGGTASWRCPRPCNATETAIAAAATSAANHDRWPSAIKRATLPRRNIGTRTMCRRRFARDWWLREYRCHCQRSNSAMVASPLPFSALTRPS